VRGDAVLDLELELEALEERWREEEEIAAIVDGELTWLPGRGPDLPTN
jgi:hypothetical protein